MKLSEVEKITNLSCRNSTVLGAHGGFPGTGGALGSLPDVGGGEASSVENVK